MPKKSVKKKKLYKIGRKMELKKGFINDASGKYDSRPVGVTDSMKTMILAGARNK